MKRAWITEARIVTASGGLDETWQGLMEGRSAIREITRFPTGGHDSSIGACIDDLVLQGRHSMIHGLLDRLFRRPLALPPRTLVLTASVKAGIDNLERLYDGEDVDTDDIQPAGCLSSSARMLDMVEPGINISSACTSSTIALARAASHDPFRCGQVGRGPVSRPGEPIRLLRLFRVAHTLAPTLQALRPEPRRPEPRRGGGPPGPCR